MKVIQLLMMLAVVVAWTHAESADSKKLDANTTTQQSTNQAGTKSQEKITQIADETRTLLDEYRMVLSRIDNTKVYNDQLKKIIDSQVSEMESIKSQIAGLKDTNKDIVPLMVRMVDMLENFVKLDVPFLKEERANRVKNLKEMLVRSDVTTSEKYRRVLEAYQVENEYGRTIESYKDVQDVGGKKLTVDFLRVGRVVFAYQSLDGNISGIWSAKDNKFVELPSGFDSSIKKAIRIAKKQMAPDLIELPVSAAEVVQ